MASQILLDKSEIAYNIQECGYCTYNTGHNILELYEVLVQVRFTPSKLNHGI